MSEGQERYICIHGHFYQPPRENPWLEAIEAQDSAYPYHDWNQCITAECYEPNTVSRILDSDDRIIKIVNNYAKISFNVGPTLPAWIKDNAAEVYEAILAADRESMSLFSRHGSALAQAYNHTILPLANRRDKYTQILWGIRDFEHRFARKPKGLWLPEAAVDSESLEILAELGIQFTILAPTQARRVRRIGGRNWRDVEGGGIDPTMAYLQRLPSGRSITLFFYDGPISRAVAFEALLSRGETFAHRLVGAFSDQRTWPQLVHVATDGETYGHHHRHGDMALAFALDYIERDELARLTNYSQYLETHPPTHSVEIFENTSWSCAHGVERWRSDCGCHTGGQAGWNQGWPLCFGSLSIGCFGSLSIGFASNSTPSTRRTHNTYSATPGRLAMIIFRLSSTVPETTSTSSWADTPFVLSKTPRKPRRSNFWSSSDMRCSCTPAAVGSSASYRESRPCRSFSTPDARFNWPRTSSTTASRKVLERLEKAKSNIPSEQDGRKIYEKSVKTHRVDWEKVGAHYAVSSLFESYPEKSRVYCYDVEREDSHSFEAGKPKLVFGRAKLTSRITLASTVLSFGALRFGDHNVSTGVRKYVGDEDYQSLLADVGEPFNRGDFPEVIRLFDREFGKSNYSLRSLFRDQQRKIVDLILDSTLEEAEAVYREFYERHASTMRFLTDMGTPPPPAFSRAAQFVLNGNLRAAFETDPLDPERVQGLLEQSRAEGVVLDSPTLAFALQGTIDRLAEGLSADPTHIEEIRSLDTAIGLSRLLPFEIELWKVQNRYFRLAEKELSDLQDRASGGDEAAKEWLQHFTSLGENLRMRV